MDDRILALLKRVAEGSVSADAAFQDLKDISFLDLEHTKIDIHRRAPQRRPGSHFRRG